MYGKQGKEQSQEQDIDHRNQGDQGREDPQAKGSVSVTLNPAYLSAQTPAPV